ncbi:MAG: M14 family zinc carboxypeptidase [Gemmatimonadota bacterium]
MSWTRCIVLTLVTSLATTLALRPASAQHAFGAADGRYDPAVPTPRAILGYELGARFTPQRLIARYLERIAATSKRVKVDTVSHTFEGREMYLITVTSEANQGRLAQIRADAQRVADPRGAAPGEVEAAVRRLPSIVWLEHSVHGGEASGVEAGLGLLYQLAAGTDAETLMALDSTVVLIDPNENPDGRERHTHDVERTGGALEVASEPGALNNGGSWPGPRTSHYYFDLNRDWFIQSHPESRGRVHAFLQWWPHVTVDLHEQGSSATFYFAPPREPDNKNNPAHLTKWFDIFAAAHGADFDAHGWSYFRREGYDSFYPGYGEGWPMLTGSVGMLFESASSAGGAVRRNDGTLRTLRQAAWEHYTAEWATVRTAARRRTELVRDYAQARADAITRHLRGPMRAVVFARDSQGRADSLVMKLRANGIDVLRLTNDVSLADATPFGAGAGRSATAGAARLVAGSYVVDFAQPQGHLAKALLEPDAQLDSTFISDELALRRAGERDRFYDITAWSLPMAYRVQSWWTRSLPAGAVAFGELPREAMPPTVRARYAYAFEPGSEASSRLLASLLRDSVRVWHAPKDFTSGGARFPHGAFVVRVAMNRDDVHDVISARATEAGARVVAIASAGVDDGTDLGSNSVVPVLPPRVALLGGAPVSGNAFGFAWYALEQRLGYPVTLVDAAFAGSAALDRFTVLVIPSTSAPALDRALGDAGRTRLVGWVRDGGVLITLDGATAWLAQERVGLVRTRVVRDSVRADSSGGAPLPSSLPGVLARATFDTLSPIMAGVAAGDLPVFANSDRVLSVPKDLRAGEAVIRFAPADRVRLAGYFWPESPSKIALSPYLWTERVGRGRVIAFAHDPVYRDLYRGMLPVFTNAVLLGGTF